MGLSKRRRLVMLGLRHFKMRYKSNMLKDTT
jgi:hypothetical protein